MTFFIACSILLLMIHAYLWSALIAKDAAGFKTLTTKESVLSGV